MQAPDRKPPLTLVFDSSLEDSIDQVLALAMLVAYDSKREARLGSVSLSHNNLRIAAFCELLVRFYRGEQPGQAVGRNAVTVGMSDRGPASTALPPMISSVLSRRTSDGSALYPRRIETLNDTADPVATIRNALTAQQDQNAAVVLSGDPVNLQGLLRLPEGKALVKRKVRLLSVAAPVGSAAGVDQLLEDWPSPIVLAGEDLNAALPFPAACIEEDFEWAANHPIVDAYRSARKMPYDAPTRAMAAVLYAVHSDDDYFGLSETEKSGQRRLIADPLKKDRVVQEFRQTVSSKPPERRGGRGGP